MHGRMRFATAAALAALAALPLGAAAQGPGAPAPDDAAYDIRTTQPDVDVSQRRERARSELLDDLGAGSLVDLAGATGTPRVVEDVDGFLTGPEEADAERIVRDYLRDNPALFGLDPGEVAGLEVVRRYTSMGRLVHLEFAQVFRGIPAVDNGITANVTTDGRIVDVGGGPHPDLRVDSIEPKLGAREALRAARRDVGDDRPAPAPARRREGPRQVTEFGPHDVARLALFGEAEGVRLVWRVMFDGPDGEAFDTVVDATTGDVLRRVPLASHANADVFEDFPGATNGGTLVTRDMTSFLTPGAAALTGPNAHAWANLDGDNVADPDEEIPPSGGGNWSYPFTPLNFAEGNCATGPPCSWDHRTGYSWSANKNQAVTQLFWNVNRFHDHLKAFPIEFTSAKGAAEGNDPLMVHALDGADGAGTGIPDANHRNNAFALTRPDGASSDLRFFLTMPVHTQNVVDTRNRSADNAYESSTVFHEYTHVMFNRLLADGDGIPDSFFFQSNAMNEGLADFYALEFLVGEGLRADSAAPAEVKHGAFARGGLTRQQAIDCPVGADASACPAPPGTAGSGGYTYGDLGSVLRAGQVHADGEIIAQTMWDLLRRLKTDHGAAVGHSRTELLLTRALELVPQNPSYLDLRNAILQADTVFQDGTDRARIWSVFAARGMGYFASVHDAEDMDPVEDFSLPPAGGGSRGAIEGRVLLENGQPAVGAIVGLGGHDTGFGGDLNDTVDAAGRYSIEGIPAREWPHLTVALPSQLVHLNEEPVTIVRNGRVVRDFVVRADRLPSSGGSFNGGDFAANGCGPLGAIDQLRFTGWQSSTNQAAQPYIALQPPASFALGSVAIDPRAPDNFGCITDPGTALGAYEVQVRETLASPLVTVASGTFTAADRGRMNEVALSNVPPQVAEIRVIKKSNQGSAANANFIGLTEIYAFAKPADGDADGDPNHSDNCPTDANAAQRDGDADGTGDACDLDGARFDFNGDGFGDLAAGAPGENAGAGLVNVIYGRAAGLTATSNRTFSQGAAAVAGDRYGAAVTGGDFNGDGFDDLAVGVPGDTARSVDDAGAVHVLYGSAAGLTTTGGVLLHEDSANVPGAAEPGDHFGASVAAGDVNGDGRSDLVVGAPDEDLGVADAGSMTVFYGDPGGLTGAASVNRSQDSAGIPDEAEAGDRFGASLAVAQLDGTDGQDQADVAVGVPGEPSGALDNAGAVMTFRGDAAGISSSGVETWQQSTEGVPGSASAGGAFGAALAAGSFDEDGRGDLAIGSPGMDQGGVDAGAVTVLRGVGARLLGTTGTKLWTQDATGVPDETEPGDRFGAALAAADFGNGARDDLAVGTPGESVGAAAQAGAVTLLYSGRTGLSPIGAQSLHQASTLVPDDPETGDAFGASLRAAERGAGADADLVVGAPQEDIGGVQDAGVLTVFYGNGPLGLGTAGLRGWSQDSAGIADAAESGDRLGDGL